MSDREFDFEICNSRMRPIAEALVKKYEELKHVDPSKILFRWSFMTKKRHIWMTTR